MDYFGQRFFLLFLFGSKASNFKLFNSSDTSSCFVVESDLVEKRLSTLDRLSWSIRKWLSKRFNTLPWSIILNILDKEAAGTLYNLHNIKKFCLCNSQLSSNFPQNRSSFAYAVLNCFSIYVQPHVNLLRAIFSCSYRIILLMNGDRFEHEHFGIRVVNEFITYCCIVGYLIVIWLWSWVWSVRKGLRKDP